MEEEGEKEEETRVRAQRTPLAQARGAHCFVTQGNNKDGSNVLLEG